MKKTFTLLFLLCVCGWIQAQTKVVLTEDFSRFTSGTEEAPDTQVLNSENGAIDATYFDTPGWKGRGVYQAGGAACIKDGFIRTPEVNLKGLFEVKLRARSMKAEGALLNISWTMPYMGQSKAFAIGNEWTEVTLTAIGWDGGISKLDFASGNAEILIDDIKVSVTALAQPQLHETTNLSHKGFTASWQAVPGADDYTLFALAQQSVGSNGICVFADIDFDQLKGSGGTEVAPVVEKDVMKKSLDDICHSDYAGWTVVAPAYVDGAIGVSGAFSASKYEMGCLRSPVYDLSGNGGNVNVRFRMKAPQAHELTVNLLSPVLGQLLHEWKIADNKTFVGTGEWEDCEMTLTGGSKESFLEMVYNGRTAADVLLIDDIRIEQQLPAGSIREHLFLKKTVEDCTYDVAVPTRYQSDPIIYYLMAKKYIDEDTFGVNYIASEYSERRMVFMEQTKVVLTEDFSKFTSGTEEAPDTQVLNSENGVIDATYFDTPGWTGRRVYQAGGAACIKDGFISTPEIDLNGLFEVKLRARSMKAEGALLNISWTMPYMGQSKAFAIGHEWTEVTLTAIGWNGGNSKLDFSPENAEMLIDDIKVSVTALAQPQLHETTNLSHKGFTASWQAVPGADDYTLFALAQQSVGSNGICVFADIDFDQLKGSGGTEMAPVVEKDVMKKSLDDICHSDYADWTVVAPAYVDGAIGVSGAFSASNYEMGCLRSPVYDLSGNGGNVSVRFRMKAPQAHELTVNLLSPVLEQPLHEWKIADNKTFVGTGEWENCEMTLTGGSKESFLEMVYNGRTAADVLLIDDIRIEQQLPAGSIREHLFLQKTVEDCTYDVAVPARYQSDPIIYYLMAKKYIEEDTFGVNYIASEYSERRMVELPQYISYIDQMLVCQDGQNFVYTAKLHDFEGSATYQQQIDSIVDTRIYISGRYSNEYPHSKGYFAEETIIPNITDKRDYTLIHRILKEGEETVLEEKSITFSRYRAGKHPVVYNVYVTPNKKCETDDIVLVCNLNVNCSYAQRVDSIVNNTIYLTGEYTLGANCVPQADVHELNLGKLPAGEYTLTHFIKETTGADNIDTTYTRSFVVHANNDKYLPLLEEGNMWYHENYYYGTNLYGNIVVEVEGDSIVNGVSYKKVYKTFNVTEGGLKPGKRELHFLGREENGAMYFHVDGQEFCFFDFSRQVGDTFSFEYENYVQSQSGSDVCNVQGVVKEITQMEGADGIMRKAFKVGVSFQHTNGDSGEWNDMTFVEGVGEMDNGIADLLINIGMTPGGNNVLLCMHDKTGKHLWGTDEDCSTINGIAPVLSHKKSDNAIYDLSGRRLSNPTKKGVYIQGGRKYIAK